MVENNFMELFLIFNLIKPFVCLMRKKQDNGLANKMIITRNLTKVPETLEEVINRNPAKAIY